MSKGPTDRCLEVLYSPDTPEAIRVYHAHPPPDLALIVDWQAKLPTIPDPSPLQLDSRSSLPARPNADVDRYDVDVLPRPAVLCQPAVQLEAVLQRPLCLFQVGLGRVLILFVRAADDDVAARTGSRDDVWRRRGSCSSVYRTRVRRGHHVRVASAPRLAASKASARMMHRLTSGAFTSNVCPRAPYTLSSLTPPRLFAPSPVALTTSPTWPISGNAYAWSRDVRRLRMIRIPRPLAFCARCLMYSGAFRVNEENLCAYGALAGRGSPEEAFTRRNWHQI